MHENFIKFYLDKGGSGTPDLDQIRLGGGMRSPNSVVQACLRFILYF